MPDNDDEKQPLTEKVKNFVVFTIYGIAIYQILDGLCDGNISLYMQKQWYQVKKRYQREIEIRQQTGSVIFEAMEAMENEK